MSKNRLTQYKEPKTKLKIKDNKIWAILYKEKNKFTYIDNSQLKDLLNIQRVKITGQYEIVDFEGIKQRVWVDGVITLSAVELEALKGNAPKDYLEECNGWELY